MICRGMHGVPRSGRGRHIVSTRDYGPKIVVSSIVRRSVANRGDPTDAKVAIFAVESHLRVVDWLSRFIRDFAADCGGGHQAQGELVRLKCGAGHNGSGELLVLVVGGGNKSAPGSS